MVDKVEVTKVAITVACSFALVFVVYNLVESVRYNGFFLNSKEQRRKRKESQIKGNLVKCLKLLNDGSLDKVKLLLLLDTLLEFSVFTEGQNQINQLGYLKKIAELLSHTDKDVQQKTALLINNLVLNEANQAILRECIPHLVKILEINKVDLYSVELFSAVLCALTNLTTLDESHSYLLPHMHVLYQLLQECDVIQIKLQVLKILVNVSTNKKICENMLELDGQLLKCMEPFIDVDVDEAFVLRAVSCCANVLQSLQRRWKYGDGLSVATPEFVSGKFQERLFELGSHENKDIQFQAKRCTDALGTPTPATSAHSMDTLDMLEVLKI